MREIRSTVAPFNKLSSNFLKTSNMSSFKTLKLQHCIWTEIPNVQRGKVGWKITAGSWLVRLLNPTKWLHCSNCSIWSDISMENMDHIHVIQLHYIFAWMQTASLFLECILRINIVCIFFIKWILFKNIYILIEPSMSPFCTHKYCQKPQLCIC